MIKTGLEFPSKTCCYSCLERRKPKTVGLLKAEERRRQRHRAKQYNWEADWGSVDYKDWQYYDWTDIWEDDVYWTDWDYPEIKSTRYFAFGWLNDAIYSETIYVTQ